MTFRIRALALLGLALAAGLSGAAIHNKGNFGISGWLVYWDPASMQSFEKHADLIDRVYPEWYTVGKDGLPEDNVHKYDTPAEQQAFLANKKRSVEIARAHGIQVISMIVNFDKDKGEHSGERVELFLNDNALRRRHIEALVANAVKDGADGIDIDYENLKARDASALVDFMKELKAECAKKNLVLAAALAPKTDADGTWDGNQAHDYKGLSASLDLIRPMTYDEHWGTSSAGPVSSPEFTEMVDRYAASVADPSKIEVGLAGYGYDWKEREGRSITYADLQALMAKYKVTPKRDPETKEITFSYKQGADTREVWFCDAGSYRPKYDLIKKYHLAGLAMWRFGSEDPRFWDDVKAYKFAKDWK